MLKDAERKLFTILVNYYSQNRCIPTFDLLEKYTNCSKADVIKLIDRLESKGYLKWREQDENTIRNLCLPSVKNKRSGLVG